jgi:ribose 5-phosphate isomerase A
MPTSTFREVVMQGKRAAARYAADQVKDGAVVGLGTGSTVAFTLERLAERMRAEGLHCLGVPTSLATERQARELGLPLTTLDEHPRLDLVIDGADEVDPQKRLIKGGGGALTREKIVAAAGREMLVVVGADKVVAKLGVKFLLPIEVLPFGQRPVSLKLHEIGCEPFLRKAKDGSVFVTDNGNSILDCRFAAGIDDPAATEAKLRAIPGVIECGLFVGLASRIVVGHDDGRVEVR